MFNKILIANRGEIAVRVIRACKELGIATVAVFSEADRHALHVQMADQALCVGDSPSKDSYLNMQNIIMAAILTKAEAIHPGFGFLSENTTFASMCEDCNIKFIGPSAAAIDAMGNKANAREVMKAAGVPVIPGSDGVVESVEEALKFAKEHGYPVLLKASAGGGGKGIRRCNDESELEKGFEAAKSEARLAFSDDAIYMEKAIVDARHIEVQVIGDEYGNIIHLGERECSMQIRNQKVLEEAPSPVLTPELRKKFGDAAILAARACDYKNAGTLEFLLDTDNKFYFMEMNTRIQVEHPITEMITGFDIVKEQISIAAGNRLSIRQEDVKISGHSIECRINAQTTGLIEYMFLPAGCLGIRVDSGIYAGYTMPPFYDSMVAKVISHGQNRDEAIAKMRRALDELVINGIETNIDVHSQILEHGGFLRGEYHTATLPQMLGL
ncbi:MAG: acetyl-CoA carboxylase biotin carboxylase subunit [Clostridiales bacterium]|jgi:acetyl-CoA carboxylase biotin carboxylase subunit|nr:acetyl-CoA carboxylase biotin carboxylase subunit [Clostridiales bacterium]